METTQVSRLRKKLDSLFSANQNKKILDQPIRAKQVYGVTWHDSRIAGAVESIFIKH